MRDVTQGSIIKHMIHMAIPSIGGGIAFTLFNITDTYFVGKLGTDSLAAMGFTFPIVMIASSVAFGVSTGAASVLSRLAGKQDRQAMQRTATDGLILSMIVVMFFSLLGLLTMDFIFPLLGADEVTLPLVKEYMTVWYLFVFVVLMPPVSDGAMRAMGDTHRPFYVMLTCAVLNIILDPILIFGWFGMPALGIQGAAIATVISRFAGTIVSLYFLSHHHKLVSYKIPSLHEIVQSWQSILSIGIPSVGVSLIPQLLRSLLTATAAGIGGAVAVAAIAVGSRIEGFINMISFSVSGSIMPLIGQNFGAGKYERVEETRHLLNRFAVLVSSMLIALLWFIVKPLADIFTNDPAVIEMASVYLRIMLFGSIGLNLYTFNGQIMNALGKSMATFKINVGGTLLILMPLVYLGGKFSFSAMMSGLAIGQLVVGAIAIREAIIQLKRLKMSEQLDAA